MSSVLASNRKRVLVFTSTFPRWENDNEPPFVFELCKGLSADFDVWVLAPHTPGSKTHESLSGLTVIRFRYFFERGETLAYNGGILANLRRNALCYLLVPLFVLSQCFTLIRLLIKNRFDAIHAHWLIPQGLTAVIVRFFFPDVALLCTSHGSDLYGLRGTVLTALKRLVLRRSDAISMVSQAMKDYAVSLGSKPTKISVISMGVDTTRLFTPADSSTPRRNELLFVGRLTSQKGLETVIRALPTLLAVYPDALLTVVGKGPLENTLRELSELLNVSGNVNFLGSVTNNKLPELYRRASVVVFPSISDEGFGLVCVEALACECSVVASNLPAEREIIQDGKTGLLFQPGNSDDLAAKILSLLASPMSAASLGQKGRTFVTQHFDWRIVVRRYANLLNQMIEEKSKTR